MVVVAHNDYGSFDSPTPLLGDADALRRLQPSSPLRPPLSSPVSASTSSPAPASAPASTASVGLRNSSKMDDSEVFLQSRPLLQDDWRAAAAHSLPGGARNGSAGGGVEPVTASACASYYASQGPPGGAPGPDGPDLSTQTVRINIGLPQPPRFPPEKMKTLIAFLWMVLNFLLTLTSLAITHERVPDYKPLPDVVLDNFWTAEWALNVSEAIIIVSVYTAFTAVVLHKHRYIVLRRIFIIMGLLYMMRSFLYFVTALPKPDANYPCEPKAGYLTVGIVVHRVLKLLGGFGLSINGQHVFCGDYIYSGHTVTLTMSYLVLREYTPRHWWLLHWTSLVVSCLGVTFVLLARGHYTVDVLIAYYFTTRLFWIYHTLANNGALKEQGPSNFLSRLWWFPMFRYFERNVLAPLPRHYQWPLPWPRCLRDKRPERTS